MRNKIMRTMVIGVVAAVFCTALIGCGNDSKATQGTETSKQTEVPEVLAADDKQAEIPQTFQETINGVKFDLQVESPQNLDTGNIYHSTAVLQKPEKDKAVETFSMGRALIEERNEQGSGENGEAYESFSGRLEDNSTLYTGVTLTYNTDFFEKIYNAFHMEKTYLYNADKYPKDRIFDFATPDQAMEKVKTMINSSGYNLSEADYIYYALDYETLQQEETVTDKSGNFVEGQNTWNAEDNCYYICAEQASQGIPVYYGSQDFPQDYDENKPIQAVYSAAGLQRLDVAQIYNFELNDEKVLFTDFHTAAEKIATKYGDILTGADYTVKRAKLYQYPVKDADGNYRTHFVWMFETHETGTDSETGEAFENVLFTLIDAETGEEVAI